jgi:hypothetical protein
MDVQEARRRFIVDSVKKLFSLNLSEPEILSSLKDTGLKEVDALDFIRLAKTETVVSGTGKNQNEKNQNENSVSTSNVNSTTQSNFNSENQFSSPTITEKNNSNVITNQSSNSNNFKANNSNLGNASAKKSVSEDSVDFSGMLGNEDSTNANSSNNKESDSMEAFDDTLQQLEDIDLQETEKNENAQKKETVRKAQNFSFDESKNIASTNFLKQKNPLSFVPVPPTSSTKLNSNSTTPIQSSNLSTQPTNNLNSKPLPQPNLQSLPKTNLQSSPQIKNQSNPQPNPSQKLIMSAPRNNFSFGPAVSKSPQNNSANYFTNLQKIAKPKTVDVKVPEIKTQNDFSKSLQSNSGVVDVKSLMSDADFEKLTQNMLSKQNSTQNSTQNSSQNLSQTPNQIPTQVSSQDSKSFQDLLEQKLSQDNKISLESNSAQEQNSIEQINSILDDDYSSDNSFGEQSFSEEPVPAKKQEKVLENKIISPMPAPTKPVVVPNLVLDNTLTKSINSNKNSFPKIKPNIVNIPKANNTSMASADNISVSKKAEINSVVSSSNDIGMDDLWRKGIVASINVKLSEMKKLKEEIDSIIQDKIDVAVKKETSQFKLILDSQKDLIISSNKAALEQKQKEVTMIIDAKINEIKDRSASLSNLVAQIELRGKEQAEVSKQISLTLEDARRTKTQMIMELNSELLKTKGSAQAFISTANNHMKEIDERIEKTLELEKNIAEGLLNQAEQKIEALAIQRADELISDLTVELNRLKTVEKDLNLSAMEEKLKLLDEFKTQFLDSVNGGLQKINASIATLNSTNALVEQQVQEKTLIIEAKIEELTNFEKQFTERMEKLISKK